MSTTTVVCGDHFAFTHHHIPFRVSHLFSFFVSPWMILLISYQCHSFFFWLLLLPIVATVVQTAACVFLCGSANQTINLYHQYNRHAVDSDFSQYEQQCTHQMRFLRMPSENTTPASHPLITKRNNIMIEQARTATRSSLSMSADTNHPRIETLLADIFRGLETKQKVYLCVHEYLVLALDDFFPFPVLIATFFHFCFVKQHSPSSIVAPLRV